MDGKKVYQIQINGITESANAVDALNKQLDALEQRIKVLQSSTIKLGATGGVSGTGKKTGAGSLSEEDKLLRQIASTEAKIKTYSKDIYQNYLAAKDVLKETLRDQKEIAAQERLQANNYTNTMKGLKERLADIKVVMQNTDISGDLFKNYTKEANEITQKLKELEAATGQFGRNVGNYASAVEGFKKIKVAVGDTIREYDNYRQAIKELKQERFQLSQSVGQEAEEYKKVDLALKQLESDYQDLNKSSSFMDNMLDTLQGFTALASLGMGLSTLFGIDDSKFNETMQKLTALLVIMKSIETIMLQIQTRQGFVAKGFIAIGKVSDAVFGAIFDVVMKVEGAILKMAVGTQRAGRIMRTSMNGVLKVLNALRITFATLLTGGILLFLPEIIDFFGKFFKSLNSSKYAADNAVQSLKALNRQLEIRRDLLASSYLKGEINDEQYLKGIYDAQTESLIRQIDALKTRASMLQTGNITNLYNLFKKERNTDFTGNRLNGETTVRSGRMIYPEGTGLGITVKDINEIEKAWKQCNEAIKEGKDYFDKWGTGLMGWVNSLFTSVNDTEIVMKGLGNLGLSDFVARFGEVNEQFKKGKINADQYAAELAKLKKEMNDSELLNSVIANLDKYIPDEEVRQAVQNIINEISKLDDAFNMTSEGQIHYWNQVRIDGMKDGLKKSLEQIKENERHEIVETGKTQKQIDLIHKKYERQRLDAQEKYNKEALEKNKAAHKKLVDAENELIALRIENMKEGLEKELAEIENQRRLALQKAKENGIKVGELTIEINKKYDQKILDEKRKWAFDVLKVYQDLAAKIDQVNRTTFEKEVSTASENTSNWASSNKLSTGYSMITPSNYDNTKYLEEYYKKVLNIEEKAADREMKIQQERLDKELEFNKKEEELRHQRAVDINNGEIIQALRDGKITQEQYNKLIEDENDAHYARMNALDKEYAANSESNTREHLETIHRLYSEYYDKIIQDITKDKAELDEIMARQPETDTQGWDVVLALKVKNTYREVISRYEKMKNDIIKKQMELSMALASGRISPEDFAIRMSEFDQEIKGIDEHIKAVQERQKMLVADFVQSITPYIQAAVQSFNQIMQAVWDAQDVAFDKEKELLEKDNDALEEALNKQQELVEKHKSEIESIEEELATSRGDRRQHLIDMLNAEIEAQRRAAAEEKRIQKEKEANEKKQEELEKKRKKAEYHRNLIQAVVNGALAVTMAAINKWPIPAIPMMALAASTTAAQIAIMAANKPYAKGGLLEGKSHANGGIPIPGTGIEVEGKEYVIRKRSSLENIDLLNYINKSERKLNLGDFIDFYGGKVKKNISAMSPGRKYADGGALPTIRNDYNFDDRLLSAFEDYSNRPVVVSVVDINNKQDQVRRVQTLAGL